MTNQKLNSILCPNCRRLISLDEPRCPYCETARPGSILKNNRLSRALRSAGIVKSTIVLNVVLFALSLVLWPGLPRFNMSSPFHFLAPDSNALFYIGATGTFSVLEHGRWWSLLSASFLHGSLLHLFFNMAAVNHIAPLVLREYGNSRTILIYLIGGAAGFLISIVGQVSFTVGASASLCSLIGAALYYGKSRGGVYGTAIYRHVSGWIIGLLIIGMMPGINNWGHGGGLLAGIALAFLLGYNEKRRETSLHRSLAAAVVLITLLAIGRGVLSLVIIRFFG